MTRFGYSAWTCSVVAVIEVDSVVPLCVEVLKCHPVDADADKTNPHCGLRRSMPLVSRSDSLVVWTGVCDDIIHTWTRVSLSLSLLVICVDVSPSTPSTVPQNTATTLRRYNSHRDSLVLHPPSTSSLTLSRLIGSVLSSAHP